MIERVYLFQGKYSIDRNGRIFNHDSNVFVNPSKNRAGMAQISLRTRVGRKGKQIHNLLVHAFLGYPLKTRERIIHLNGDKMDNRLENIKLVPFKSGYRKKIKGFDRRKDLTMENNPGWTCLKDEVLRLGIYEPTLASKNTKGTINASRGGSYRVTVPYMGQLLDVGTYDSLEEANYWSNYFKEVAREKEKIYKA